jgi:hypothetical protein
VTVVAFMGHGSERYEMCACGHTLEMGVRSGATSSKRRRERGGMEMCGHNKLDVGGYIEGTWKSVAMTRVCECGHRLE